MPATYEPIASTTLVSNSTSIFFSSIPSTYTDIVLVTHLRYIEATTGWDALVRLNADATSNYSRTVLFGTGSSVGSTRLLAGSQSNTSIASFYIPGASAGTSTYGTGTLQIMNYANTNVFKTVLSANSNSAESMSRGVHLWRSTSAVNSVEILVWPGYTFGAGCTASLYGIRAA